MITKKILVGIQLFFFIFVVSMASSAMADGDPACAQENVCSLLDSAADHLDTAYDYIEGLGMVKRTRGRVILLRAYADLTRAQIQIIKCPIAGLIDLKADFELKEFMDLIKKLPPLIESGKDILTVETVLLIAKSAIIFAEIDTMGLYDKDALHNIFIAKALVKKLSTVIGD